MRYVAWDFGGKEATTAVLAWPPRTCTGVPLKGNMTSQLLAHAVGTAITATVLCQGG